jgi:hypothetical protein
MEKKGKGAKITISLPNKQRWRGSAEQSNGKASQSLGNAYPSNIEQGQNTAMLCAVKAAHLCQGQPKRRSARHGKGKAKNRNAWA